VMAAAVGLFMTRPPSIATHEVSPLVDRSFAGLKKEGTTDVARQISHKVKFHFSSMSSHVRKNRNEPTLSKL